MTEIKGNLFAVLILHNIFSGDFLLRIFNNRSSPMMLYAYELVVEPFSRFFCFLCLRTLVLNFQQFVPKCLRFFTNGAMVPIIIFEKLLYDYFIDNFDKDLKIDRANLTWPLYGALLFGLMTINIDAGIDLSEKVRDQIKRKTEWLKKAAGVGNFNLPTCVTCEIPFVVRANHCSVCDKCVAKYEVHSSVLNVCIGAKNLIPYFLFYCFLALYHVKMYMLGCDVITKGFYTNITKFEIPVLGYSLVFAAGHSVKEVLLMGLGILTNTTYKERAENFQKIYFKTKRSGITNPFYKGVCNNIMEAFVVFLKTKAVVDPNKNLPKLDSEGPIGKGEEFYQQLNLDITDGIYDWGREFIFTMTEIDCEARDLAIKLIRKKRARGTDFTSDESLSDSSEDSEEGCGHDGCQEGNSKVPSTATGYQFKGEKFNRDALGYTPSPVNNQASTGDVQLTDITSHSTIEKPDESTDLLA